MTHPLFLTFAGISVLFLMILVIKSFSKYKLCVLCVAVATTWISLLILYWKGIFVDNILLSILIGNSVVGFYYLIEKKISEKFYIFRLPFFLTLLLIGYELISFAALIQIASAMILVGILWLLTAILFIYRNNPSFKKTVSALIECCKNW